MWRWVRDSVAGKNAQSATVGDGRVLVIDPNEQLPSSMNGHYQQQPMSLSAADPVEWAQQFDEHWRAAESLIDSHPNGPSSIDAIVAVFDHFNKMTWLLLTEVCY